MVRMMNRQDGNSSGNGGSRQWKRPEKDCGCQETGDQDHDGDDDVHVDVDVDLENNNCSWSVARKKLLRQS